MNAVGIHLFTAILIFCFLQTPAGAAPSELIVRLKAASTTHFNLSAQQPWQSGTVETQKLNSSSDGQLLHLKFSTPEAAEAARVKLTHSSDVENVAPNFFYHTELFQRVHDLGRVVDFFAIPFAKGPAKFLAKLFDQSAAPIPTVQLPSENIQTGDDPLISKDWALSKIDMPSVETVSMIQADAAKKIITAVIDTGVDYNHEDLIGAMWRSPADPKVVGHDFAHNRPEPYDVRHYDMEGCLKNASCQLGVDAEKFLTNPGHGTHCAGHIGAVANNSVGIRGVGGNVQIMALKFFYDVGDLNAGNGDDAGALQAVNYAIKNGAKIINASWGNREKRKAAEKSELKKALMRARAAGILVVIAAGNDNIDQDSDTEPSFPAAYDLDNLIVVTATDQSDQLAGFSNYGAKSVNIAAPGVKILSTTAGETFYSDEVIQYQDDKGNGHEVDWDGTSMASPIVAGAASLIWSKYPDETYLEIKNRILKSARPVDGLTGKVSSGGVLDVSAALSL